jgi:hypothetical protein
MACDVTILMQSVSRAIGRGGPLATSEAIAFWAQKSRNRAKQIVRTWKMGRTYVQKYIIQSHDQGWWGEGGGGW